MSITLFSPWIMSQKGDFSGPTTAIYIGGWMVTIFFLIMLVERCFLEGVIMEEVDQVQILGLSF